jgi:hypothetical protein
MRIMWIILLILLSTCLWADIQFTQEGSLAFTAGAFLSTELSTYQGVERLLTYTLVDSTELDVQIGNLQGELQDTLLIHWPFPEKVVQVSFFEEEGARRLAVLGGFQADSTLVYSMRILDLDTRLSIGFTDLIPYDNGGLSSIECRDFLVSVHDLTDGHVIFAGWETHPRYMSYHDGQWHVYTSHSTTLSMIDFHQGVLLYQGQFPGSGRVADIVGDRWLISEAYVCRYLELDIGDAMFGISAMSATYFSEIILKYFGDLDYVGGILDSMDYKMNVLSMNSLQPLETFTMLETGTHIPGVVFSERRLTSGVIWFTLETNLHWRDAANEPILPPPTSCLDGFDGTPMVIYFDQDGQYEIRSRVDGSITEWGQSPFGTPWRIFRLSDGTPVFLAQIESGMTIWTSAMAPVAISSESIPTADVVLFPNLPNPFNPETTIAYSLPSKTQVEISVYNIKGQLVKTLCRGVEEAGDHFVRWNGTDSQNHSCASGIYFCRVSAGSQSKTQKMLLLK